VKCEWRIVKKFTIDHSPFTIFYQLSAQFRHLLCTLLDVDLGRYT